MREGGKSAKAKASGQSKAMCLEVRQLLWGTLSMMKQDCAYLLNQKHKSKPAGGVSRVLFMQTAPSPLPGPRGKWLSLCQLIQTFGSPKVGVGQGPAKHGSRESAFSSHHRAWASLTLTFGRHFLKNVLRARQRSHLGLELPLMGEGRRAWTEGHQSCGQKQLCLSKSPNEGVVSSGENFQLGFVRSGGC